MSKQVETVGCDTCGYAHKITEPGCMNPQCIDQHGITPERRERLLEQHAAYKRAEEERQERQRLYAQSFQRRSES